MTSNQCSSCGGDCGRTKHCNYAPILTTHELEAVKAIVAKWDYATEAAIEAYLLGKSCTGITQHDVRAHVRADTDKLKAAALAATPGPWEMSVEAFDNDGQPESVVTAMNGKAFVAVTLDFGPNNPLMREANALYLAAANPAAILELIAKNEELERKAFAYDEWSKKTDWVQEQISTFPITVLGKHRADVMREEIERLRGKLAEAERQRDHFEMICGSAVNLLRANIETANDLERQLHEAERRQVPVATVFHDEYGGGQHIEFTTMMPKGELIRLYAAPPVHHADLLNVAIAVRDACHAAWVSSMENWRSDVDVRAIVDAIAAAPEAKE